MSDPTCIRCEQYKEAPVFRTAVETIARVDGTDEARTFIAEELAEYHANGHSFHLVAA